MKTHLLIATIVFAALRSSIAADSEHATLTLKGDTVILKNASKSLEFGYNKVPGFATVQFVSKVSSENGKEIDVSELTLENQTDGSKLTLTEATPVSVLWEAQTSTSKPAPRNSTEPGAAANP